MEWRSEEKASRFVVPFMFCHLFCSFVYCVVAFVKFQMNDAGDFLTTTQIEKMRKRRRTKNVNKKEKNETISRRKAFSKQASKKGSQRITGARGTECANHRTKPWGHETRHGTEEHSRWRRKATFWIGTFMSFIYASIAPFFFFFQYTHLSSPRSFLPTSAPSISSFVRLAVWLSQWSCASVNGDQLHISLESEQLGTRTLFSLSLYLHTTCIQQWVVWLLLLFLCECRQRNNCEAARHWASTLLLRRTAIRCRRHRCYAKPVRYTRFNQTERTIERWFFFRSHSSAARSHFCSASRCIFLFLFRSSPFSSSMYFWLCCFIIACHAFVCVDRTPLDIIGSLCADTDGSKR